MATFDQVLRLLDTSGGDEMLLASGRPICFLVQGSVRPLSSTPATTEQIVQLLGAALTQAARAALETAGLADFRHRSADGVDVDIHVETREGAVFVRVRRRGTGASEGGGELLLEEEEEEAPPAAAAAPGSAFPETARDFDFQDDGGGPLEIDAPEALVVEDLIGPAHAAPLASAGVAGLVTPAGLSGAPAAAAPSLSPPPHAGVPAAPAPAVSAGGVAPGTLEPMLGALLRFLVQQKGSDLHLAVGSPPRIRLHGMLLPLPNQPPLEASQVAAMLDSVLDDTQRRRFGTDMALDFSFSLPGLARFRSNACVERKGMRLVFRAIPPRIPTFEELGLPKGVDSLTKFPNGLILVTGPAGCGKTTTQAAIVDRINETWRDHVITVEDPIEYLHPAKSCLVNQREVGRHVRTFAEALKSALREDPDVILVGELRDLETIQLAITAAETGHLVLGTLHTIDAARTVDRIIDVFPGRQKTQIRSMVSESLRGVVSQQLIRTADGKGRVPAFELLLTDRSISNLIREGKTFQIANAIRLGKGRGMCAMDDSIVDLVRKGVVTRDAGLEHAANPDAMRKALDAAASPANANPARPGATGATGAGRPAGTPGAVPGGAKGHVRGGG